VFAVAYAFAQTSASALSIAKFELGPDESDKGFTTINYLLVVHKDMSQWNHDVSRATCSSSISSMR
jgi:hypothetical protein